MPFISANTDARGEGYFRLEWKLAADRSRLRAQDQPCWGAFLRKAGLGD